MATAARDIGNTLRAPGALPEPIPVIADGGGGARVILVDFPAPPLVGDRFAFGGIVWEIVRSPDHARGFVARPCPGRANPGDSSAS